MAVSDNDKNVLRELAKQKAETAALPVQQETINLHKKLNALQPERPMVMIDQVAWHEMDTEEKELELKCEDVFCRSIETGLRREQYRWKHMRADMVVEPFIRIGKAVEGCHFGIKVDDNRAVLDPHNSVVGHSYNDQIQTEDDLEKLKDPVIALNEEVNNFRRETAEDIFDGIIDVRMDGIIPYFAPWDRIVEWRGTDNMFMDLLDRPEFIHKLLKRTSDIYHMQLDQLEEKGLLGFGYPLIHCTGAWSDELPSAEDTVEKPTAKDNWTFGMAQIFSSVSPDMHTEFEINYSIPWYERFGLGYYGCCEPLDLKVDIIRRIPNVRKISMSPWVELERGAEAIGKDFVFSRKPSPAFLAWDEWRPDLVREDLEATKAACDKHGCPLEFILKDISTVSYEPQRLWEWSDIAMKVAES